MTSPNDDTPATLRRLWPAFAPSPLLKLDRLAHALGVADVLVKDESHRPLGNFKSLGGLYAGLRMLVRAAGVSGIEALISRPGGTSLPTLVCASDGNHGLAVAEAARLAGARARVFLHDSVPASRAARIAATGGDIVWVAGTYDDAVDAAAQAAADGEGLLIADTTDDVDDPVVAEVLAGYGLMADELCDQLGAQQASPTHLFVQAGVGGLAAALAERLRDRLADPRKIVVVEPETAACVTVALAAGRPRRVDGDLETSADMLACGKASAPALRILRQAGAASVVVSERELATARTLLPDLGGPPTTASGAAGLAGLMAALSRPDIAASLALGQSSRVLLIVTEGAVADS